jgi:ADP-heptose:LPS heptosyltransferase
MQHPLPHFSFPFYMHKEQLQFALSSLGNLLVNDLKQPILGKDIQSVLILKTDEIGDMVYTLHILEECIKHIRPNHLHVFCKSMNAELVEHISSDIQLHTKDLPAGRFDLVLDLRSNFKHMLQAMFKGKHRLDRGTVRLSNKFHGGQKHEVYTNWEVLEPVLPSNRTFHYPTINPPVALAQRILDKHSIPPSFFLIHAGARDASRRWPLDRFKEVILWICEQHDWVPVLVGGPSDAEVIDELSKSLEAIEHHNLAGKTTLMELAGLCREAKFFLGNESGPVHFANVMSTPLVVLFGPGVKDVFYPYHKNAKVLHPMQVENPILKIEVEHVKAAFGALFP